MPEMAEVRIGIYRINQIIQACWYVAKKLRMIAFKPQKSIGAKGLHQALCRGQAEKLVKCPPVIYFTIRPVAIFE